MKPIGIFDSGVGGLTVWKEIAKRLPNEDLIYVADSGNAPYGPQTIEQITAHTFRITDFLLSKGCKIIVVACNTATAAAIDALRAKYDIPFIGVEPAIKPAALHTTTGCVGVLATKGTLESRLFHETSKKYADNIRVNVQIGQGLVELIEQHQIESEKMYQLLHTYLQPMIDDNVDAIVLGCTHYPFLIPTLKKILPDTIDIINPAPAVARQTRHILNNNHLLKTQVDRPIYDFYTTGNIAILNEFIQEVTTNQYSTYVW